MEVETGGTVSVPDGAFSVPTVLKFTPHESHTEYNVGFDGLTSDVDSSGRTTHFSDRVTLAATHEFPGWRHLALAAGPQLTLFTRGSSGVRAGGIGVARTSFSKFDGGLTASYSRATHSSDLNPTHLLDLGGGFGRRVTARATAHVNYLYEKATGYSPQHSLYEGVEFQLTPRFALDLSVQQVGVGGPVVDHQLVAGLTMNLGRPGSWLVRRH